MVLIKTPQKLTTTKENASLEITAKVFSVRLAETELFYVQRPQRETISRKKGEEAKESLNEKQNLVSDKKLKFYKRLIISSDILTGKN